MRTTIAVHSEADAAQARARLAELEPLRAGSREAAAEAWELADRLARFEGDKARRAQPARLLRDLHGETGP